MIGRRRSEAWLRHSTANIYPYLRMRLWLMLSRSSSCGTRTATADLGVNDGSMSGPTSDGAPLSSSSGTVRPPNVGTPDSKINGFLSTLNEQGVPWGIITNGRLSQHVKCRGAGLAELARFVIVSEEVGYEKPDPRIYHDGLARLSIDEPSTAMMVGDNPASDIDGAKRVGMRAVWVRRGRKYPQGLKQPDYVIDGVIEVTDLIGL